ncbi:MAG: phosphoadenosine phosphosulfate reductase [Campylobacterota bacterium]|nr:phosphoadenosine phosphosulfate reductase [Campylobacterota bacterium]
MNLFENLKERVENLDSFEIIKVLSSEYADKSVFASSLGMEDQVITQMISQANKKIKIFTLDTGRLFQETYALIDRTKEKLGVEIEVFFPDYKEVEKLTTQKGMNSFYNSIEDRKECCHIRKIEPLKRALNGAKIWVSGLRSAQSVTRKDNLKVEFDETFGVIKLNPLLDWSLEDVEKYIKASRIPYNPLHDNGFVSIGCMPCTRAIKEGEDIRAGRWWWENPEQKECGLHKR